MKIHHFFCEFTRNGEILTITDKAIVHQIKNVLKLKKGEAVIIASNREPAKQAAIVSATTKEILLKVLADNIQGYRPKNNVALYAAIIKKDNFELLTQKAVEVGVSVIVPIITERTVKKGLNFSRLQSIVRESAEQCGRFDLPVVAAPLNLKEALQQAVDADRKIMIMESGANLVNTRDGIVKPCAVFIGPEGGWSEKELKYFAEKQLALVGMGESVFRAETAAIVATYLLAN